MSGFVQISHLMTAGRSVFCLAMTFYRVPTWCHSLPLVHRHHEEEHRHRHAIECVASGRIGWLSQVGGRPALIRADEGTGVRTCKFLGRIYILYIQYWIATMTRTTLFQTNRSQAVRLPKDVAFPPDVREVTILRDGARRIVVPADRLWDDFFDASGIDFGDRDQPPIQPRETF